MAFNPEAVQVTPEDETAALFLTGADAGFLGGIILAGAGTLAVAALFSTVEVLLGKEKSQ